MSTQLSEFHALLSAESSTAIPRISNAQLLDAPENRELRDLWTQPAADPKMHAGKKIGVIATDGVEEIELTSVLHYFKSRGALVHLISPSKPSYPAYLGLQIPAVRETHILTIRYIETAGWIEFDKTLDEVNSADYDAVVVPGGAWNPDALRVEPKAIAFVQEMALAGKTVASICHGPWVLSDAGLLKGKRATAWWAMKPDLENAGAIYVDEPVVVDDNIVTSRAPIDLAPFVRAIGEHLSQAR